MSSDKKFDEISVGDWCEFSTSIREQDLSAFAELSGDRNPLHIDAGFAAHAGFSGRVVYGMLLTALFSRLVGMEMPGKHALYLSQEVSFLHPVYPGETLVVSGTVRQKVDSLRILVIETKIFNERGTLVVDGIAKVKCLA